MAFSIGFFVYAFVQFVAFLLVLVAIPTEMYRFRSLWYPCPARRERFRAAQGFALISIFVYGAAFVLGAIMVFCCRVLRWICLALNSVGVVTLCVVWVVVQVTYNRNDGDRCEELKASYTYAAGFVLLLIAWALDILNIPILLFLCREGSLGESGNAPGNKAQECDEETKEKETQV